MEKKTDAQITWINLNLFVIEDFLLICSQLTGNRNIKVDVIGNGRLVQRLFLLKLQCVYKNKKTYSFQKNIFGRILRDKDISLAPSSACERV